MKMNKLETILKQLKDGKISVNEAMTAIDLFGLDFVENEVKMDSGRYLRKGIPEIVFAEKKRPELVLKIVSSLMKKKDSLLLSRVKDEHLTILKQEFTDFFNLTIRPKFEPYTVTITSKNYTQEKSNQKIGILTAGTSDIPIAEEAAAIAELMGVEVITFHDVGVAGVHRLFDPLKRLVEQKIKVLIVIAGMEGALPTIVSGLVNIPVIGVPTSTGYGYGGGGTAALMTMLQSCSPGLVVVNIDNGINAGATAALIAKQSK
jgi:NCAIR mutase (PurE)-related protein